MSDWKFLEQHRCTKPNSFVPEQCCSDSSYGFNGMFRFIINGQMIRCIASDGEGWQHVSVTVEGDKRPPKWDVMCHVKDFFWEDEHVVMQLHPRKSEYVNMHPGCLHLWRPTSPGVKIPEPPSILVGLK